MCFGCSSFCCNVLSVIIVSCIVIVAYFQWSYSYWKRNNLPYLTPTAWYGTMENPFSRTNTLGIWLKQNYDELKKRGLKHGGIYNFAAPVYLPVDPDLVKYVIQTDFRYFIDRGFYYNEKVDPLSAHLFALDGQKWKNLRAKLTPTFTSGKMKMMFETLIQCSDPLKSAVDELTKSNQEVDIKELVARYTTDVIGSCAFGLECNSFKSPDAEFRQCGKRIFQRSAFKQMLDLICMSKPSFGHLLNIRILPKFPSNFFFKVVRDTINYRENNNVKRNDMLQLLINMKADEKDKSEEHRNNSLSIKEIAAQCMIFFLAGFETSSTTMTFCLYELAQHPEIQQKVRDEINAVLAKHGGEITYDCMSELKFMVQVIEETLRKYPPLPQITRKCVKDYPVPNSNVVIEKGTSVFISVYGLHHDADYYPNPECFDPDRFSPENKQKRHQFTYVPFGEGPRLCIGLRFGMMQMIVGLIVLLKNYKFSVNKKTPSRLTFHPKKFLLDVLETIWLDSELAY